MIDSEIHVAIKSYKRAGTITTHEIVPFAHVWIPQSQEKEYREQHDQVITIPDELDGSLARKQNAILDQSPCKWTLILDDDITGIGYWEDGEHIWMEPEQIRALIIQGFLMADELGIKLWGINQRKDELCYQTYKPINLLAPILGPFHGHLDPILRYDDTVKGKDDYDFWLQNIKRNRKTLRFNKYHYVHDHGKLSGGFVSMRSMQVEKDGVERMLAKWGSKIFKPGGASGGKSATGKNILNSLIKISLQGC